MTTFNPQDVLKDKRPIQWVAWADGNAFLRVGKDDVTRIVAYPEYGQFSMVPWLAVYKGDFLWQRIDISGKEIGYSQ